MLDTDKLVQLIAWYASERGEKLSLIRIVKFLYLLDLFYARSHEGHTLTNWPWKFVHYGPYCGEASDAIELAVRGKLVEQMPYRSKYSDEDKFLFACKMDKEPSIADSLPDKVRSELKTAIDRWAGSTAELLDYVYFSTEPMQDIEPGTILDFRKAQPFIRQQKIAMKGLPAKQVAKGKEAIRALSQRFEKSQAELRSANRQEIKDSAYDQALTFLDGAGLDTGLSGEAKLG